MSNSKIKLSADSLDKLSNCRANLCDAQLDLMNFVEGSGYIRPDNDYLLTLYGVIKQIILYIDYLTD